MSPNQAQTEEKVVRLDLSDNTANIGGTHWMNFQGIIEFMDTISDISCYDWRLFDAVPDIMEEEWVLTFRREKVPETPANTSKSPPLAHDDDLAICGCGTVVFRALVGSKPCSLCQRFGMVSGK